MLTHHPVLQALIAFDLIIGVLLSRYLWVIRGTGRTRKVPLSWTTIICLVNLSAVFCGATVEEAIAGFGGLALVVLILSAIAAQAKFKGKA